MAGTTFNPEQPASTAVTPYFTTSIGTGGGGNVPSVNGFRMTGNTTALSTPLSPFTPAFQDEVLVMVCIQITTAATAGTKTMRANLTWTDAEGTAHSVVGIPMIEMGSSSGALDIDTSTLNTWSGFAYVIVSGQTQVSLTTTLGAGSNPVYDISVKTFLI